MINIFAIINEVSKKIEKEGVGNPVAVPLLMIILKDANARFWQEPLQYSTHDLAKRLHTTPATLYKAIRQLVQWQIITYEVSTHGSYVRVLKKFFTEKSSIDAVSKSIPDSDSAVRQLNRYSSYTPYSENRYSSDDEKSMQSSTSPTEQKDERYSRNTAESANRYSSYTASDSVEKVEKHEETSMNSSTSNETLLSTNTLSTLSTNTNTYFNTNTRDKDKRYDNPIKQGLSVTNVTENLPSQTSQSEEKPINPEGLPPWYGKLSENEQKVVDAWQYIVGPFKEEWLPSLRKVLQACYPAQIINSISTFARTKVEAMQGMGFEYVVDPLLKGMFGKRPANKEKKPKDEYKEKMKNFGNIIQRMKEKQERGEL